ncbi:hypothetical protein FRX31_032704, partial [Thalictrum thalictroides]
LNGNASISSHGRSSEAREPELIQGAFLNTPIVHDQRNMNQVQKYERQYGNVPVSWQGSSSEPYVNPLLLPIVNPQKDNPQSQNFVRSSNVAMQQNSGGSETEQNRTGTGTGTGMNQRYIFDSSSGHPEGNRIFYRRKKPN